MAVLLWGESATASAGTVIAGPDCKLCTDAVPPATEPAWRAGKAACITLMLEPTELQAAATAAAGIEKAEWQRQSEHRRLKEAERQRADDRRRQLADAHAEQVCAHVVEAVEALVVDEEVRPEEVTRRDILDQAADKMLEALGLLDRLPEAEAPKPRKLPKFAASVPIDDLLSTTKDERMEEQLDLWELLMPRIESVVKVPIV